MSIIILLIIYNTYMNIYIYKFLLWRICMYFYCIQLIIIYMFITCFLMFGLFTLVGVRKGFLDHSDQIPWGAGGHVAYVGVRKCFWDHFRSNSMGCGRAGRAGGHIFKLYLNFVLACATSGKILQSFPPCWLLRLFPPVPWDDCCFLTALLIGLICLLQRVYKFASHHGGKF